MSREHHAGCIPSHVMSPWLSSALDQMTLERKAAIGTIVTLWVSVVVLSAGFASGPIYRHGFPRSWSSEFFVTTALGPLAVFRWPYPAIQLSTSDYVGALLFTVSVTVLSAGHVIRPKSWTAVLLIGVMGLWLLIGLAATYAWV
jgi:hypothetical protein